MNSINTINLIVFVVALWCVLPLAESYGNLRHRDLDNGRKNICPEQELKYDGEVNFNLPSQFGKLCSKFCSDRGRRRIEDTEQAYLDRSLYCCCMARPYEEPTPDNHYGKSD